MTMESHAYHTAISQAIMTDCRVPELTLTQTALAPASHCMSAAHSTSEHILTKGHLSALIRMRSEMDLESSQTVTHIAIMFTRHLGTHALSALDGNQEEPPARSPLSE